MIENKKDFLPEEEIKYSENNEPVTETDFPGVFTPYGKKLSYSIEEKLKLTESLTQRERDAYLLLLEGFTLKEIAKLLHIGYPTANTYQTAVYRKLHVKSRAELIINYRDVDGGNSTE